MLSYWIKSQGFTESDCDPFLYIGNDGNSAVSFHINNLLVAGNVDHFKEAFVAKFHRPKTLLGVKVVCKDGLIQLSLPLHIEKSLRKMDMINCRAVSTPLTPCLHLPPANDNNNQTFLDLNISYCSPIGWLNFISGLACPDISFAVSSLAKNCEKPGLSHWNKVCHVWKYLSHTKDLSLTLGS